MKQLSSYFSLVKFSHTIFAMPFAMIGFFTAIRLFGASFTWQTFLLVLLCMVSARNAAMAFNRYLDRDIDIKNPRTAIREIPAGIIHADSALWFVLINAAIFCTATFFINHLVFYLSPVALAVILGYSYTKRFTALCHFVLGLGLSLAPIGAFLSVTGYFSLLPVLYSFCVLFWVSGFDIIYALQDEDFDKKEKLSSIPTFLGREKAMQLSSLIHLLSGLTLIAAGIYGDRGAWYWAGTAVFSGLMFYQHIIILSLIHI